MGFREATEEVLAAQWATRCCVGVQGRAAPPKPSLKDGSYDAGQQNLTSAAHRNPPAAIDKPPLAAFDRS
jgi:hypothetical protein